MGDENLASADVVFLKRRVLGTTMDTCLESKPSICDVINLIYQAALQPLLWSEILSDIRTLCDVDQCTLFFYDAIEPGQCIAGAARADEQVVTHYLKNFIRQQATQINSQLKALPEGQVVTNDDVRLITGAEYSEIVGADYMQNFWPNLKFEAGIVLLRSNNSSAGLGLQNFNNSPPLTAQSITLLEKLSPHLRQAMRAHQKFTELDNTNNALKKVLQSCKSGIILLDEKFSVKFINHQAKHSLEKINAQHLTKKLTLEKIGSEQIHNIVNQFNTSKDSKIKLDNSPESQIVYKDGHLKVNGYSLKNFPTIINTVDFPQNESGYLILIQDSNVTCSLNPQYLHSAYEITATERNLILGLINGGSLLDNADSQKVKRSTGRWHLKNIMHKTLTHSQTELVRLMIQLRD